MSAFDDLIETTEDTVLDTFDHLSPQDRCRAIGALADALEIRARAATCDLAGNVLVEAAERYVREGSETPPDSPFEPAGDCPVKVVPHSNDFPFRLERRWRWAPMAGEEERRFIWGDWLLMDYLADDSPYTFSRACRTHAFGDARHEVEFRRVDRRKP
ncbi:MAG: hypothetical protein GY716_15830 [bacterium]|nr:hypothetical protein [bacterium]